MVEAWRVGYVHNVDEKLSFRLLRANPDNGKVEDFNQRHQDLNPAP